MRFRDDLARWLKESDIADTWEEDADNLIRFLTDNGWTAPKRWTVEPSRNPGVWQIKDGDVARVCNVVDADLADELCEYLNGRHP